MKQSSMILSTILCCIFIFTACGGGSGNKGDAPLPKSWVTAELIETDNVGDAYNPQIAFDGNGNAIAVWQQEDGTADSIFANRYTPGNGWGTTVEPIEDETGDVSGPQIAIDSSGNAIAVWQQDDGAADSIFANGYSEWWNAWVSAEPIENGTGSAGEPQIAFDGSGNAIAVWRQKDDATGYDNILASRYTANSGWSTAEPIEGDDDEAGYPHIAFDGSGNAIAVWEYYDGTRRNIWANRYTPGTGWGTAEPVETDDANAEGAQISVDSSGNAIAIWSQSDSTRYNVWANRYE